MFLCFHRSLIPTAFWPYVLCFARHKRPGANSKFSQCISDLNPLRVISNNKLDYENDLSWTAVGTSRSGRNRGRESSHLVSNDARDDRRLPAFWRIAQGRTVTAHNHTWAHNESTRTCVCIKWRQHVSMRKLEARSVRESPRTVIAAIHRRKYRQFLAVVDWFCL